MPRKPKVHKREPLPSHPIALECGIPVHRILCGQRGGPLGVFSMQTWQHVNCQRCLRYL